MKKLVKVMIVISIIVGVPTVACSYMFDKDGEEAIDDLYEVKEYETMTLEDDEVENDKAHVNKRK